AAGADLHRPAGERRAPPELPPPRRVGGGQPQHGAGGLRGPRVRWPGRQPAGPGHFRRRRCRRCSRAGRDRRRRSAPRRRGGPWPARAGDRDDGLRQHPRKCWGGGAAAAAGPPRPCRGERGNRGAAGAAPADRPARGGAGELRALPQRRGAADGAAPGRRPRGRRRGAGGDARHLDRPALRSAEGGGAPGAAGSGVPRPPRQSDELVAGEAITRSFGSVSAFFVEVGNMVILTTKTLVSAVRPPFPYGEELVEQCLFTLKLCWFPLLISTFALNLGAPGLQAAGPLQIFGALDRLGGFFVLTAIRWIGPLVTAVVVAGVAGTAITADLGARKIREELDALQVLGVDPIKNLVVPRFVALMVITGLLDIFAIVFGLTAGIAAELLYNQPLGGFFATLFTDALIADVWASVLMCTLFGGIIAVVCCYKGMSASGGAAGVGRAVNQAVVISLVTVFFFQFVVSSVLLATNPELQAIR